MHLHLVEASEGELSELGMVARGLATCARCRAGRRTDGRQPGMSDAGSGRKVGGVGANRLPARRQRRRALIS